MSQFPETHQTQTYPSGRCWRGCALVGITGLLAICVGIGALAYALRWLDDFRGVNNDVISKVFVESVQEAYGEHPHIVVVPTDPATMPVCDTVPTQLDGAFQRAFGLMRGTAEGSRLYDELVSQHICVSLEELNYDFAYAQPRRVGPSDWSQTKVVVDPDFVRTGRADVLAALLVHE